MAVAKHNKRPRTTVHRDLLAIIESDAKVNGRSVGMQIAHVLEEHYKREGRYPLKDNLKHSK